MRSRFNKLAAALAIFLSVLVLSGGAGSAIADTAQSSSGSTAAVAVQTSDAADAADARDQESVAAVAANNKNELPAEEPPPGGDVEPQIIGGNLPTQNYPAGAKVTLKYDAPAHGREAWHTCGASLIDGMHIVTAAHCVTDPPAETAEDLTALAHTFRMDAQSLAIPTKDKSFWVRVGSDNIHAGTLANARVKWVHEDWAWATIPGADVHDVAVLELDRYVDAYELPLAPRAARPGDQVYMLGWGLTMASGGGEIPTGIRELRTSVIADVNCADAGMGTRDVCVGNPNGTSGVCYGDSGGPLLVKINGVWYTFGPTSRMASPICGRTPVIYTSAPEYAREIYDVLAQQPEPVLTAPSVGKTAPAFTQPYEPGNP